MEIEQQPPQGVWTVLAVSGRIDAHTAPEFDAACRAPIERGVTQLAIDLAAVSYVSSAGLRVLLAMLKLVGRSGGAIALVAPRDNVREVLDISGFSSLFAIVESTDELD